MVKTRDASVRSIRFPFLPARTSEGVYRSSDAGQSCSLALAAPMVSDIAINPFDTSLVLAACGNFDTAGNGGCRSTDGGMTFI